MTEASSKREWFETTRFSTPCQDAKPKALENNKKIGLAIYLVVENPKNQQLNAPGFNERVLTFNLRTVLLGN